MNVQHLNLPPFQLRDRINDEPIRLNLKFEIGTVIMLNVFCIIFH